MLLLKRFSPSAFAIIDTFMDHDADRQKVYSSSKSPLTLIIIIINVINVTMNKVDSPAWKIHELLVVNLVRETLKLEQFTQKVLKFSPPLFFRGVGVGQCPNENKSFLVSCSFSNSQTISQDKY